MNDLNGLKWSTNSSAGQKQSNNASAFAALRPVPTVSGKTPPLSTSSTPAVPSRPTASATSDSFSNLVSFSSSNPKNLSLQEQQKRLADLKLQDLASRKQTLQNQWAGNDDAWNNLGSGRSTPSVPQGNVKPTPTQAEDEDDLFAVFNAPVAKPAATVTSSASRGDLLPTVEDDDDPFGLSEFQAKAKAAGPPVRTTASHNVQNDDNDDDFLGDLGRPVSERSFASKKSERSQAQTHPQDKAIAELMDMGFPADRSRQALEVTESGLDVQAAVGWLLHQAHAESQSKARGRNTSSNGLAEPRQELHSQRPARSPLGREPVNADTARDRSSTQSGTNEFGSTLIKTAGSFWKSAQKQVQQAYSEFNSDSDSSQPKWMKETQQSRQSSRPAQLEDDAGPTRRRRRSSATKKPSSVTDEAMMLEAQRPTPPPRQVQRPRQDARFDSSADTSRDHSPVMPSRLRESGTPQPAFLRAQAQSPAATTAASRPSSQQNTSSRLTLNRQAADEQASQAYVSSARRRKPQPAPPSVPEPDLFNTSVPLSRAAATKAVSTTSDRAPASKPRAQASVPIAVRPSAPQRQIPTVSGISLKASHAARTDGNTHFKRGDYSAAHQSYSTALSHIPGTHPIAIVLLTNRALTALKTGEPKIAIADADKAIGVIGPSKGESETVDLGMLGEIPKPMREYYGKALMRKAEALEQMEKWTDAATVWKLCVEDGHGGHQAIQGRMRAEKAAQPKPPARPIARKPAARASPAISRPALHEHKSSAAVAALRQANAAAEKADDEKFALTDSVNARVTNWRGGKQDNLRALLSSLDAVLWPEAAWKKISMADLILPQKVKIQYMKGIAKVHPDKIPTSATTEQKMIAGAVFSTLNEAWDKFKAENNL